MKLNEKLFLFLVLVFYFFNCIKKLFLCDFLFFLNYINFLKLQIKYVLCVKFKKRKLKLYIHCLLNRNNKKILF